MLQFGEDHLHRPAVGHVAGQILVVDGHMGRDRVHHDLHCLPQRQVLLVLPPADINEVEPVGGDGRGVHGTELLPAHPGRPATEQIHPVLLGDVLRQARDGHAGKLPAGRGLHLTLPMLKMSVGQVVNEREVGHREDVVHDLPVLVEGLWTERFWRTIKYDYIYIRPEGNGAAFYQGILRFMDEPPSSPGKRPTNTKQALPAIGCMTLLAI